VSISGFKIIEKEDEYGSFEINEPFDFIDNPKISIIMGVYNAENFLARAIDSILKQTYINFEFIIINDGSSDKSKRIIEAYQKKDNRILLINQKNMGLTKSLNRGLLLSKGEYIARQDADDISHVSRIEKQIYILNKYSLDIVTARGIKDNKPVPNKLILNFNSCNILRAGNVFIHGTFFMHRYVFDIQMYNENYQYAQDFKFILDALGNDLKIGYMQEELYYLNNHDKSISNTKKNIQDKFVSRSLIEFFGNDRCFMYINNTKYFKNINKLLITIYLHLFSRDCKFAIIDECGGI